MQIIIKLANSDNRKMMQDIEKIEQAHAVKVLLRVLKEETIPKSMLYQKIGKNTDVLSKRIEELKAIGLLNEEEVRTDALRKMISLTEKGRRVAEHLQAIEDILGE